MDIFSWFFSSSLNQETTFSHTGIDINPANGLPMIGDAHSLDILGNPYGMDLSNGSGFSSHCSSEFGSGGLFSGGGSFGGGCGGGGFSGGMNDW